MTTIYEDTVNQIETSQGNRASVKLTKMGIWITVPQYLCKKLAVDQEVKVIVELLV